MLPNLPPIFRRDGIADVGLSQNDLRRLLRRGEVAHLRRRVYATATALTAADADPRLAYELQVRAAQMSVDTESVACGTTAVRLLDGALPLGASDDVELIAHAPHAKVRRKDGVHLFRADLPAEQVATVNGILTTSPERTTVDVGRRGRLGDALVVGDSLLRVGHPMDDLDAVVDSLAGTPGIRRARLGVQHLDARHETPLESESVGFFLDRELPLPDPQVWIGEDRVDFLWRRQRVIGEADGRVKYLRALRKSPAAEEDEGDPLWLEKQRVERLERLGFTVVRWTYGDLFRRTAELERRLRYYLGAPSLTEWERKAG